MDEFKAFAIDTAYRCGWTFSQAFLSCMTFGQSIVDIDWKGSLLVSIGAVVFVLLKQLGKWCLEHIKEPDELPRQFTFNSDSFNEMLDETVYKAKVGDDNGEENDTASEQ